MSRLLKVSIACILALGMILAAGAAHAAGFSVSTAVDPLTAAPGDTVEVSVTFTVGDTAIRGVQVLISFPEGLVFSTATAPDGWTDYAGGPSILAIGASNLEPGASAKFTVLFTVSEGAVDTQKITFTRIAAASVVTAPEQVKSHTGTLSGADEGGGINVDIMRNTDIPGDANGDNSVDILDLVSIIDYIVSNTDPTSLTNADANGDGTVDILDLVWIIDRIVGR